MIWEKLVKLALLGTERSTLTPEMLQILEANGIDTNQETNKIVLEAAAYYAPLQKAGWQAATATTTLVPSAIPTETLCTTKSAKHLEVILNSYPLLLEEFLEGLATHHQVLPYEFLPNLFDRCVKDTNLWLKVQPVIGTRGQWLLPLNTAWKNLQTETEISDWKIATKEARILILTQVREANSPEALALLQSTWEEDGLKEKANLLKCLKIGLSLSDEPFLEQCLDSPRKEIRIEAAKLLCQLPESQLQQRLQQQLASLITFDKKEATAIITLPDMEHIALNRDGIDPKNKVAASPKLSMLVQMVQVVPPDFWLSHLKASKEEVVQLFAQSDPSFSLVNALIYTTGLHQATQWMEVLLEFWIRQYYQKNGQHIVLLPIFEVLPNELFNKFLYQKLNNLAKLPEEQSPLVRLLQLNGQKWDKSLALVVMAQLKAWMASNPSFSYSGLTYRTILKQQAAYAISPALHPEMSAFWLVDQNNWAGWEQDIQRFLNILSFRKEMARNNM